MFYFSPLSKDQPFKNQFLPHGTQNPTQTQDAPLSPSFPSSSTFFLFFSYLLLFFAYLLYELMLTTDFVDWCSFPEWTLG